MFSDFRNNRGGYTSLMAGLACLVLAGFAALAPLPVRGRLFLMLAFGIAGIAGISAWWLRRRTDRYDLSRLWEEPPPAADEAYEDHLPEGEEGAPYCGWCNEVYPAGTYRCRHCGRVL